MVLGNRGRQHRFVVLLVISYFTELQNEGERFFYDAAQQRGFCHTFSTDSSEYIRYFAIVTDGAS
jgi:hypothetical protein